MSEKSSSTQGSEGSETPNEGEAERPEDYLESTLLEIHELISDIENPFTLVGKLVASIGKDKTLEVLTGEKKDEPKDQDRNPQGSPSVPAFATLQKKLENEIAKAAQKQEDASSTSKNLVDHESIPGPSKQDSQSVPATKESNPAKEESVKKSQGSDLESSEKAGDKAMEGASTEKISATPVEPPLSPHTASESAVAPVTIDAEHPDQEEPMLHYPSTIRIQSEGVNEVGMQNGPQTGFSDNLDLAQKLNSLELANVLAMLFGKDGSIEVLGCYAKRNWVEEEVARLILDAITLLGKVDSTKVGQGVKEATTQDHRIALYLIQQYSKSIMSSQESARFSDQIALIKSIIEVTPKPSSAPAFRESDLR